MKYIQMLCILLLIFSFCSTVSSVPYIASQDNFSVVVDAGSSGSRVHVYRWRRRKKDVSALPSSGVVEPGLGILTVPSIVASKQLRPGISSLTPSTVCEYIQGMVDFATNTLVKGKVPLTHLKRYSFYLKATAGMRVLTQFKRDALMRQIRECLSNRAFSPFKFSWRNAVVISGEQEGIFSWIDLNTLRGALFPKRETQSNLKTQLDSTSNADSTNPNNVAFLGSPENVCVIFFSILNLFFVGNFVPNDFFRYFSKIHHSCKGGHIFSCAGGSFGCFDNSSMYCKKQNNSTNTNKISRKNVAPQYSNIYSDKNTNTKKEMNFQGRQNLPLSVGVLGMGGASAQVVFRPQHDIISNYYPLYLPGLPHSKNIGLYSQSYLGFGYTQASIRLMNILKKKHEKNNPLHHPCYASGLTIELHGVTIIGTSDPDACIALMTSLFGDPQTNNKMCFVQNCSFNGVYQPRILNSKFIAIDAFAKSRLSLGISSDATLSEWNTNMTKLCKLNWDDIRNGEDENKHLLEKENLEDVKIKNLNTLLFGLPTQECRDLWKYGDITRHSSAVIAAAGKCGEKIEDLCFRAVYFYSFLVHLGVDKNTRNIQYKSEINGSQPSLARGFMIQEVAKMPILIDGFELDGISYRSAFYSTFFGCIIFACLWLYVSTKPVHVSQLYSDI